MLDPVVHIQKQSLGIADGDMYPQQYLLHALLVRNHRLVSLYMFYELMVGGGIVSGQFDGRFKVFLRNVGDCLCLQVRNDLCIFRCPTTLEGFPFLGCLCEGALSTMTTILDFL